MYVKIIENEQVYIYQCSGLSMRTDDDGKTKHLVLKDNDKELQFLFTEETPPSVFVMNDAGQTIDRLI